MHRPILLLATFVLGISSIAVTLVSASLERPAASGATDSNHVSTILRYYDAVNQMIATGDPTALREVVHPEVIDLEPSPVGPGGREGIEGYLAYLHEIMPDARLEPGPVAGNGAQVIAQVSVRRYASSLPLGFSMDKASMLWPSSEVFLVSSGQIIERQFRWDGLAAIKPVDAFPIAPGISEQRTLEVTLNRYMPQAAGGFATVVMPAVLLLVSGNLSFSLSRWAPDSALVLNASFHEGPEIRERVLPGQTTKLGPGDVLVVPSDSAYSISNLWPDPASVLSVSDGFPYSVEPEPDTFALFPHHRISVRSLLTLPAQELDAPSQLSFGTASMMPGSRLTVDPATSLMVLLTDSGQLYVDSGQSTCENSDEQAIEYMDIEQDLSNLQLLCPNDSAATMVFNGGDDPALAWIVALNTRRDDH